MADLNLNGPKSKTLRKALISAFPSSGALARFTNDQLDLSINTITGNSGLEDMAFDLIDYCKAHGRLSELITGARAQNPGNPKLQAFERSISLGASASVPADNLEKVVSDNDVFLDVLKWRTGLTEREFRVGRVERNGKGLGTGFLVGPDLLLTNYHVVMSAISDSAAGSSLGWAVRFDYQAALDGVAVEAGTSVDFADTDWLIDHSPYHQLDTKRIDERNGEEPDTEHLDFALIRLSKPIGEESRRGASEDERSWVELPTAEPEWEAIGAISILQHPVGDPLKLALGVPAALTLNAPRSRVRYTVPTDGGSSGSPVFDGDWNLVALHHSGDPDTISPEYNEAIPIQLISNRDKVKAVLP